MKSEVWSSDALWQKAKAFMQKAADSTADQEQALWCSLALEMLARAALATVHPALLAEVGSNDSENLLFAFGATVPKKGAKSIGLAEVLKRLRALRSEFLEDHANICATFAGSRNEELHSGALGFEKMITTNWRADFYRAAEPLLKIIGRKEFEFYGKAEAKVAKKLLVQANKELIAQTKKAIAGRKALFESKTQDAQTEALAAASEKAEHASLSGAHRVECPACGSKAIIQGIPSSTSDPQLENGEVVVRQNILPNRFKCFACGLILTSTAALQVEKLAKPYTRTMRYSPLDYYAQDYEEYDEYNND